MPAPESEIKLEVKWEEGSFLINGVIKGATSKTHQENVRILKLGLEYSPVLTDCITPLADLFKKRKSGIEKKIAPTADDNVQEAEPIA